MAFKKVEPPIEQIKLIHSIECCSNCRISMEDYKKGRRYMFYPRVSVVIYTDEGEAFDSDILCSTKCGIEWLDKNKFVDKGERKLI